MDPEAHECCREMRWRYFSQGSAEGWLEGRMDVVLEQLALRLGAVPAMAEVRIRSATREELDRVAEAVLTAGSLVEALLFMTGSRVRYLSDFARIPFEKGKANGKLQGRANIVREQLLLRFGNMSDSVYRQLCDAQMPDLKRIAARLLTAKTMREAVADSEPAAPERDKQPPAARGENPDA